MLSIAAAEVAICWQLTSHALAKPSALVSFAAVVLAAVIIALVARSGWLGAVTAGPLPGRVAALRRKSWAAAFQRQRDPDAAGHARPRAPSPGPAAA